MGANGDCRNFHNEKGIVYLIVNISGQEATTNAAVRFRFSHDLF